MLWLILRQPPSPSEPPLSHLGIKLQCFAIALRTMLKYLTDNWLLHKLMLTIRISQENANLHLLKEFLTDNVNIGGVTVPISRFFFSLLGWPRWLHFTVMSRKIVAVKERQKIYHGKCFIHSYEKLIQLFLAKIKKITSFYHEIEVISVQEY